MGIQNGQTECLQTRSGCFFGTSKTHNNSTINSPSQISYRNSLMSSIPSSLATFIQNLSFQRVAVKYSKGKHLIMSSHLMLESFTDKQKTISIIKEDLNLVKCFIEGNISNYSDFSFDRDYFISLKHDMGKLIFSMALQTVYSLHRETMVDHLQRITKCLHYQIYYSLQLKIYPVALESLIQCSRFFAEYKLYEKSEYFCEIALKIAVSEYNEYFEEAALEQISFCQYKLGNIEQARNLHDNVSKISLQSRKQILKSYNQDKYVSTLREYLYNGTQLSTDRNVRLVETIGFNQNKQNLINYKELNNTPTINRLKISNINRTIHDFQKSQQKANDLRKSSYEKAIKSIRLKHLYKIQEVNQDKLVNSNPNRKLGPENNGQLYKLRQCQMLNRSQVSKNATLCEANEKHLKVFRTFLQYFQAALQRKFS